MILKNVFDSHGHWLSTGQSVSSLQLNHLRSPSELKKIKLLPEYFRGQILTGSGWDQNLFTEGKFPTRQDLDKIYPDFPVSFKRVDGHALWVNTKMLKLAGLFESPTIIAGGEIILDSFGVPTGILIDLAGSAVNALIPDFSKLQIKNFLLKGCEHFNKNGFTHIRDLSCDEDQWSAAYELDKNNQLTLAIDQYFSAFDPNNFEIQLKLAMKAKAEKLNSIKAKGIKVWYDGALGSEGALISQDYNSRKNHRGLRLISAEQLSEIFIKTFEKNLDLAIHVIGDQAAKEVVDLALHLQGNGIFGKLHLEHAQLLSLETILKLKKLNVVCHLQPSHWLSDKGWLNKKVGTLNSLAFQWSQLELNNIKFDFGSDSPVEVPSIFRTLEAVLDAEVNGVAATAQHPWVYHEYYDEKWIANCSTHIEDQKILKTVFRGQTVYELAT